MSVKVRGVAVVAQDGDKIYLLYSTDVSEATVEELPQVDPYAPAEKDPRITPDLPKRVLSATFGAFNIVHTQPAAVALLTEGLPLAGEAATSEAEGATCKL